MNMDAQEAALGLLSMGMGGSGLNGAGPSSSSSSSAAAAVGASLVGGAGTSIQQQMYQTQQQQQRQVHHHHHHPASASTPTTTTPTTSSPVSFPPPHPQHHHHQSYQHHRQHSPPSTSSSPHPHPHQTQQQHQQQQQQQQQQQHAHLHSHHFPPPTSSATLNSILGPPSVSPLIPAKRKMVQLDEGYETGRGVRGGVGPGEGRDGGIIRDGREIGIGMGMGREVQGFGVGYGRVSAQRDEGEMMRMGMGTPIARSGAAQKSPPGPTPSAVMDAAFHHRPSSRPTSSSSSAAGSFNAYPPNPQPTTTTMGKGRVSSPSLYIRGSMPPPTPLSPPPPPIPASSITTPPSKKSKPLPPPDPPPPPSSSMPRPSPSPAPTPNTLSVPSHPEPTSTDGIDCICGINFDDGFSVACDECGRWCHMVCFNFPPSGQGQNAASDIEFRCWRCEARSPGMAVRAREIMRKVEARAAAAGGGGVGVASVGGPGGGGLGEGVGDGRRRSPVGSVEGGRRGRKTSAPVGAAGAEATGTKRKRRNSGVNSVANGVGGPLTAISATTSTGAAAAAAVSGAVTGAVEEEHVDIDEPWNQAYVHIREDIVTDDETRQKLRMHAKNWRGITAIIDDPSSSSSPQPSSSSPVLNPTTKLKPIPQNVISAQPLLSPSYTSTHPSILPPAYSLHTTTPLASNSLIIPLKSRISTSTSYLRDPLNSYAHLGMPRPFVHLVGPPLDLSLDGRCVGNEARWVRSGCVPNAVLRPVLCREGKGRVKRRGRVDMVKEKEKERETEGEEMDVDVEAEQGVVGKSKGKGKEKAREGAEDDSTLGFALFATRDLKANEEVVLGWEWDDGNVVHMLPALMNTPGMFSIPPPPTTATAHSASQITQLRNQMANILHALSSTFATCACGAGSKDCVLARMQAFVQASSSSSSFLGREGGAGDAGAWVEALGMALDGRVHGHGRGRGVDLGPLVGTDKVRGFRARERVPGSGGLGGMEVVPPRVVKGDAVAGKEREKGRGKGKGRERVVVDASLVDEELNRPTHYLDPQRQQHDLRPFDPGTHEERIHPRMRKKWMKGVVQEKRKEEEEGGARQRKTLTQDELAQLAMPPPPMPASMDPTTVSSAEEARRVGLVGVSTTMNVGEGVGGGRESERSGGKESERGVDTGEKEEGMVVDVISHDVSVQRRDEVADVVMRDDETTPGGGRSEPELGVGDDVHTSVTTEAEHAPPVQPSHWSSPRPQVDSRELSPELGVPPLSAASTGPPPSSATSVGPPPSSATSTGPPPSSAASTGPPPSSATSTGPPPSSATSIFSDISLVETVKDNDTSAPATVDPIPTPPPTSASTVEGGENGDGDGDETEDEMLPLKEKKKEKNGEVVVVVTAPPPELGTVRAKSRSLSRSRSDSPPLSDPPVSSPSTRSASPTASPIPVVNILPPDAEDDASSLNANAITLNGHSKRLSLSPSPLPIPSMSPLTKLSDVVTSPHVKLSPLTKPPSLSADAPPSEVVVSPRVKPMRIDTDVSRADVQEVESSPFSPMSSAWSPNGEGAGDEMEGVLEGKQGADIGAEKDGKDEDIMSHHDDKHTSSPSDVQPPTSPQTHLSTHTDEAAGETTSNAAHEPEPEPEPEPTPAPATKKKLSLAEFIARKKKMKEEGQGATTPTAGGMTPTAGPGATLTPTAGPGATLTPIAGPGAMLTPIAGPGASLLPVSGGGTSLLGVGGVHAGTLTPTNGVSATLTPGAGQGAALTPTPTGTAAWTPSGSAGVGLPSPRISGAAGMPVVGGGGGGLGVGLGLGLRGVGGGSGGMVSATASPMSTISVIVEGEEKDGMVVDKGEEADKDSDDAMKVDEELSTNGRDHASKENLSPLLTMREFKDAPSAASALSKDVKKMLDSPAHHALSPLIGVGSLNMPLTNGHSSTPLHSLSPVPPSTLGLGLGLGVPSSLSLAPSPLSQSPDIATKEAKKELLDVSLSAMNPGSRKATASPAILSDEHRFSRKLPTSTSPITSTHPATTSSATSPAVPASSSAPTVKSGTPPPHAHAHPATSALSSSRPTVHAPAPSAPSPLGLAPSSPIHPDARNWQASPPPASSSLSSPTMTRSPINGPRTGYRYLHSSSSSMSGMDRMQPAHARRQSQEDGEIGEHESEGDARRASGPLSASHLSSSHSPHPSSSHAPHSSFNTPPAASSANPIGPKRGVVPFPFRTNYGFAGNAANHGQHTPSHSPPTHPRSFGGPKSALPSRPGSFAANNNNIRTNGITSDADSASTPTSTSTQTPTSLKGPAIPSQPSKPATTPTSTPAPTMPSNYGQNPPTAPRALRQSITGKVPPGRLPPYQYQYGYHPYAGWAAPSPNNPVPDPTPANSSTSNGTGPGSAASSANGASTPTGPGNEHFIPRGPASQMRDRHKDDGERDPREGGAGVNRDRDRCLPGSRWDSSAAGAHRDGVSERDVRDVRDGGHYAGPGLGRYRGGMPGARGRYGGGWGEGSHWRK